MILKELDSCTAPADQLMKAGRAAEEQMAYYLRRAFGCNEMIDVVNGLRLEMDADIAQMDHLVLHPFGVVIIESKSVTTRVRANDRGEWARWFAGSWKGMPDSVLSSGGKATVASYFPYAVLASS